MAVVKVVAAVEDAAWRAALDADMAKFFRVAICLEVGELQPLGRLPSKKPELKAPTWPSWPVQPQQYMPSCKDCL